ncbi:hypothetical protein Hanom_Chr05g00443151 [Helianthus anomalus]
MHNHDKKWLIGITEASSLLSLTLSSNALRAQSAAIRKPEKKDQAFYHKRTRLGVKTKVGELASQPERWGLATTRD